MSNPENLPAEIDQVELAAIYKSMGITQEELGDRTPRFRVNYADEDAEENTLPKGLFTITGTEGPQVFAKEATIRPLGQHFQYTHYDGDAEKMISQTILVPNMRDEMTDDIGSTRCGMPAAKSKLSDEQKALYKDISAVRQLRCLVTMTGEDLEGNEVTITDQPAVLNLSGASFMSFEDEFMKGLPRGRNMIDYLTKVTRTKKKKGSTTYWEIHFEPDFKTPMPMTIETVQTLKTFLDSVDAFNEMIRRKHDKALAEKNSDDTTLGALGDEGGLDDDLIDDEVAA